MEQMVTRDLVENFVEEVKYDKVVELVDMLKVSCTNGEVVYLVVVVTLVDLAIFSMHLTNFF